jgi:catechol 2,3-dioxygenase-like lactoylglutathione lyase family enzyme
MSDQIRTRGVNHVALVCSDMARTVAFYEGLLGFSLIKTVELPGGMGQHFFFDIGGGDSLAFFWFPEAPDAAPGLSQALERPDRGDIVSGVGSMNHIAFDVAPEDIDGYRETLQRNGIACSEVVNHDDSEWTVAEVVHPGVFVRSVYFQDPDGISLELAAWHRALTPADVAHAPSATPTVAQPATPSPA